MEAINARERFLGFIWKMQQTKMALVRRMFLYVHVHLIDSCDGNNNV